MTGYVISARNQDGYALPYYGLNTDATLQLVVASEATSTDPLPAGSWLIVADCPCYLAQSVNVGAAGPGSALPLLAAGQYGPFTTAPGDIFSVVNTDGSTAGTVTLVPLVAQ